MEWPDSSGLCDVLSVPENLLSPSRTPGRSHPLSTTKKEEIVHRFADRFDVGFNVSQHLDFLIVIVVNMLITLFAIVGLLGPLFYVADSWIPSQYVFDPKKLQEISKNAISIHGNNTAPLLAQITRDLKAEYGDAINGDWTKEDWFFNNAGGAMVCQQLESVDVLGLEQK